MRSPDISVGRGKGAEAFGLDTTLSGRPLENQNRANSVVINGLDLGVDRSQQEVICPGRIDHASIRQFLSDFIGGLPRYWIVRSSREDPNRGMVAVIDHVSSSIFENEPYEWCAQLFRYARRLNQYGFEAFVFFSLVNDRYMLEFSIPPHRVDFIQKEVGTDLRYVLN